MYLRAAYEFSYFLQNAFRNNKYIKIKFLNTSLHSLKKKMLRSA